MILIGCPVYKRDWILPAWFYFIQRQSIPLHDIGFVFELGVDDKETLDTLAAWKMQHPEVKIFDLEIRNDLAHFAHEEGQRQWSYSKYENMVSMRNSLLQKAREIKPDAYFSLDSDVLLINYTTLELLLAHVNNGADAVNTLMFMTPFGTDFPSVMSWVEGEGRKKAYRKTDYPLGSFFKSDVIMAAKMMSPKTYNSSQYRFHMQGEDLGWSADCAEKGLDLYCASYIYTPHIMGKAELEKFLLNRGDPRQMASFGALQKV